MLTNKEQLYYYYYYINIYIIIFNIIIIIIIIIIISVTYHGMRLGTLLLTNELALARNAVSLLYIFEIGLTYSFFLGYIRCI